MRAIPHSRNSATTNNLSTSPRSPNAYNGSSHHPSMVPVANNIASLYPEAFWNTRFPFTVEQSPSSATAAIAANTGTPTIPNSDSDNKLYYYSDINKVYVIKEPLSY